MSSLKEKKVSNLSLTMCKILDVLEPDVLDLIKIKSIGVAIDKFFYDVDRQIRKKIKDEFHQLDFTHHDLVLISDSAKKHLNRLQPKCTYASMKKTIVSMLPLHSGDFTKYQQEMIDNSYIVTLLNRIVSVSSYQAILVELLEGEDQMFSMENVLSTVLDELRSKS